MKILLTHRYFWPDTAPYASMLRAMGNALAGAGHDVHVLASVPSYRTDGSQDEALKRERMGLLHIRRAWVFAHEKSNPLRRLANVVLYCVALFVTVLRLRPDVVTASTFPPVIAAWVASLAIKLTGGRFIYHIQDIHPEVSINSGARLGRGLPMWIQRALDYQTLRRSHAIVVLSQDMADTLNERGLSDLPIHIINNFSLDLFDGTQEPPAELRKPAGKKRVIFAGNLGRFQKLPQLAQGVAILFESYPQLELFFLGDGTALPALKRKWGDHPQVGFGPFLPFAQAKALIEEADVGLVSLEKDLYRAAYPSKIASYLSQGVPVLALVERESCIAAQIRENALGATAIVDDPQDVATALEGLLLAKDNPRERLLAWSKKEVVAEAILPLWVDLIGRQERTEI